jgi:DNA-cytosine methyltransferase
LTVGSLFSGVGCLDAGLVRTGGFEIIWHCENNDYASAVLGHHFPGLPNFGDISKVDWESVPKPDVLCGGFPCTDVSISGKGKGIKVGTRSGLWLEYAKAINVLRPKYVIVENVPMLIRRGINIVLADLSSAGYDAVWTDLRASDFGALHRRERIFIVATRQEGYTPYSDCQRRDNRGDEAGIRTLEERELDSQDEERRRVFAALAERANAINGHFEKFLASSLRRLPEFDWCQGIERIEDLFNQEGIPQPVFRGEDVWPSSGVDASPEEVKSRRAANAERINRIKCVGNAVVPACSQIIGEYILEIESGKRTSSNKEVDINGSI